MLKWRSDLSLFQLKLEDIGKNIIFARILCFIMSTINKIGIFCSSSNNLDASYYEEADCLGRWIGSHGLTLVCGGASCGLMETLSRAVHESGGKVLGVVPQILIDRERVSTCIDDMVVTEDLNDRKRKLIENSDIILALPGSVGTLDEVFTVMAANTIGIHDKKVVFWNINGFWSELFSMFDKMALTGVVTKPYDSIMVKANTFEQVLHIIEPAL